MHEGVCLRETRTLHLCEQPSWPCFLDCGQTASPGKLGGRECMQGCILAGGGLSELKDRAGAALRPLHYNIIRFLQSHLHSVRDGERGCMKSSARDEDSTLAQTTIMTVLPRLRADSLSQQAGRWRMHAKLSPCGSLSGSKDHARTALPPPHYDTIRFLQSPHLHSVRDGERGCTQGVCARRGLHTCTNNHHDRASPTAGRQPLPASREVENACKATSLREFV